MDDDNFKYPSVVAEMRGYWLEGQTGGQQLLGYTKDSPHINVERTMWPILAAITRALSTNHLDPIAAWEIQAEERDKFFYN